MTSITLKLNILPDRFAVCKVNREEKLVAWITASPFFCITRTYDELSIVCLEEYVPNGIKSEKGWRAIKFEGPLDFRLVGILNSVTSPLAKAQISVYAISTYETDYVLVKAAQLEKAVEELLKDVN